MTKKSNIFLITHIRLQRKYSNVSFFSVWSPTLPILQAVTGFVLLNKGIKNVIIYVAVLGSLPVDSCLSDRHASLESHPHTPEPFSAVTTEEDGKKWEKNRRQRRERVKKKKSASVCRRDELPYLGSSLKARCWVCVHVSLRKGWS